MVTKIEKLSRNYRTFLHLTDLLNSDKYRPNFTSFTSNEYGLQSTHSSSHCSSSNLAVWKLQIVKNLLDRQKVNYDLIWISKILRTNMILLRFKFLLNLIQLKCQSYLFSHYLQFCSTLWSSSNRFVYFKSMDQFWQFTHRKDTEKSHWFSASEENWW